MGKNIALFYRGVLVAVLLIVIFTVSIIQDADAKKGVGVPNSKIFSKAICGDSFCLDDGWSAQTNNQNHLNYLLETQNRFEENENEEKDVDTSFKFGETIKKLPPIIRIVSLIDNMDLVKYSDGSWQIISSTFLDGVNTLENSEGVKFSFGGTLGLSSDSASQTSGLELSQSIILIPKDNSLQFIEILGNTNSSSFSNILLSIKYPDGSIDSFIIPVDNEGKFSVNFLYDKNTKPGTYQIKASYQEFILGTASFTASHESSVDTENQFGSLTEDEMPPGRVRVVTEEITLPTNRYEKTNVGIEGRMGDYSRGEFVTVSIIMPDGSSNFQKVLATRDGYYQTIIFLDHESLPGEYLVEIEYEDMYITSTSFFVEGNSVQGIR